LRKLKADLKYFPEGLSLPLYLELRLASPDVPAFFHPRFFDFQTWFGFDFLANECQEIHVRA